MCEDLPSAGAPALLVPHVSHVALAVNPPPALLAAEVPQAPAGEGNPAQTHPAPREVDRRLIPPRRCPSPPSMMSSCQVMPTGDGPSMPGRSHAP
jgi:hypothetical protein